MHSSPDSHSYGFPLQWLPVLDEDSVRDAFLSASQYVGDHALPPPPLRYEALRRTSPEAVRVVVVGDGLFSHAGKAHGVAYSAPFSLDRRPLPATLRNFQSELAVCAGLPVSDFCDLVPLAQQGVLLLNRFWTLDAQGDAHSNAGWDVVSRGVVRWLSLRTNPIVFVILGNQLRDWVRDIPHHHPVILTAAPSPQEATYGFFGGHVFSRINRCLDDLKHAPIDWGVVFAPRSLPPPILDRRFFRRISDRQKVACINSDASSLQTI